MKPSVQHQPIASLSFGFSERRVRRFESQFKVENKDYLDASRLRVMKISYYTQHSPCFSKTMASLTTNTAELRHKEFQGYLCFDFILLVKNTLRLNELHI